MADPKSTKIHSFALQKQSASASHQPLELYHLSHDLRGPLNSMLGFSELLLEGIEGPLNEVQIEDILAIRQSSQNLLRLINAVVDLSRLEAGQLNLNLAPVDLDHTIQQVLDDFSKTAGVDQVKIVSQIPAGLLPVTGDRERVRQMILELLTFAFERTGSGQIKVSANQDEHEITLCLQAEDLMIPADELKTLFDLVVKVDPAGRSELGAGGLMLPLVQKLAQQHQGQAWAEPDSRQGTVFYLKLPLESS